MSKSSVLDTTVKTYLINCINSDDTELKTVADKIKFSRKDFYSSQQWNVKRIGEQSAVKEWLQGLPSSISIAFMNYEILQLAVKWDSLPADYTERQADKIIENWFNLLAAKLCQLWRGYRVPDVTKNIRVFDNGGQSLDRYTVFPYLKSNDINEKVMYLGLSNYGLGVSMWGEVNSSDLSNLSFLGNEIAFSDLPDELQQHIISRIS